MPRGMCWQKWESPSIEFVSLSRDMVRRALVRGVGVGCGSRTIFELDRSYQPNLLDYSNFSQPSQAKEILSVY